MPRSSRARHEAQFPVHRESVMQFFANENNWNAVYPYLNHERESRRFFEHFVTEYARAYRCEYPLKDPTTGRESLFNVYHDAQTVLLGVHKRHMDPFSRKNRNAVNDGFFEFGHGDKRCQVTVCELVFFRWALKKGVLAYADAHAAEIREDMARMSRVKREAPKRKAPDEVVIELPTHPLKDAYWQSSTQEKKALPRKERKRYRRSAVSTVFNDEIEERHTFGGGSASAMRPVAV